MRNKFILIHIAFWIFEIFRWYYATFWMGFPETLAVQYTISCILYLPLLFYINYFILIPVIIKHKAIWTYFLWGFIHVLTYTIGYTWWVWYFKSDLDLITDLPEDILIWKGKLEINWDCIWYASHEVAFYGAVSTVLRFYWDWKTNQITSQKIKQSSLQTEIDELGKLIDFPTLDRYLKVTQYSDFKVKKNLILDLSAILRQNLYNEDLSFEQFKILIQKLIHFHNISQSVPCKVNFKTTKICNEHFLMVNNALKKSPSLVIIYKDRVETK